MRKVTYFCVAVITLFFLTTFQVRAESPTPTPTPTPQVQSSNEFTVQDEPSSIVTLLKNFIEGFDSVLGGFIFYTPNPLADSITLKDNSVIPGVTKYRDIFYEISIPVIAIVIAGFGISKIGSDNTYELKSFATRVLIVIVMFITVPMAMSYSIQFTNLLNDKISTTQKFTGFLNTYFDQSQERINKGDHPEIFGIPSFDMSLKDGLFKSFGKGLVELFLFAITFLFLLCGFLFLGYQFVIRFATLLFLGVIYPVVLPFYLTERTQGIVSTFFKTWFTFLIQQPAFILGFSIATDIFSSILNAKGPSVGLLFFYTGFLFFLGGVNMLVGRIFGDAWASMSGNMVAAVASRTMTSPIQSGFDGFKKGLFGGNISNALGRQVKNTWLEKFEKKEDKKGGTSTEKKTSVAKSSYFQPEYKNETKVTAKSQFAETLAGKGFMIEQQNPKQGVVALTGEAYRYDDNKLDLTTYYPTLTEALQDGIAQENLQKVKFNQEQFIDLSSFNKKNPNPHNFNAMEESKKQGKEIDYAHINKSSPPQKIKNFLEMAKARNETLGINGVIVERQAKEGNDPIVRIYSHKSYEKH